MATKNYVGARYVPKFADPVEWQSNKEYEGLIIVSYNGGSYTSKKPVPSTIGNPSENADYWAFTGNYNGQVEIYRQEVKGLSEALETAKTDIQEDIDNINDKLDFIISADSGSDITEELQTKLNNGTVMLDGKDYVISSPITVTNHASLYGNGSKITYSGTNADEYMIKYNYTGADDYSKNGVIDNICLDCNGSINGINYINARTITTRSVKVQNPYTVGFHLEKNVGAYFENCAVMQQAFSSSGTTFRNKITGFDSHLGTDTVYSDCVTLFTYIGFYLGGADNVQQCHPLGLANLDNSDVIDSGSIAFKLGGNAIYIDHGYSDNCAIGVQSDQARSNINITDFYDFFYTGENTNVMKKCFDLECANYSDKVWYLELNINGVYYPQGRKDVIGYYWPEDATLWLPFLQNAYIDFKKGNQFSDRWTKENDIAAIPWFNKGTVEETSFSTSGKKYTLLCQLFDDPSFFENNYAYIGLDLISNALNLHGVELVQRPEGTVLVMSKGTMSSSATGVTLTLCRVTWNTKPYLAIYGGFDWGSLGLVKLSGWGCKLIGPGRLDEDDVTVNQDEIATWTL